MIHLPVQEFRTAAELAASLWFLALVTAGVSWAATTVVSLFTFLALAMFVFVVVLYAAAATMDTGQKAYIAAMHFLNGPDLGHTNTGDVHARSAGLVRKAGHGRQGSTTSADRCPSPGYETAGSSTDEDLG